MILLVKIMHLGWVFVGKGVQNTLTGALPMAFLQARPAERGGGLAFLCPSNDLQQVFVDETLRQYRHHQVAAPPMGAPNLPAEAPAYIEVVCGGVHETHRGCSTFLSVAPPMFCLHVLLNILHLPSLFRNSGLRQGWLSYKPPSA